MDTELLLTIITSDTYAETSTRILLLHITIDVVVRGGGGDNGAVTLLVHTCTYRTYINRYIEKLRTTYCYHGFRCRHHHHLVLHILANSSTNTFRIHFLINQFSF